MKKRIFKKFFCSFKYSVYEEGTLSARLQCEIYKQSSEFLNLLSLPS